MLILHLQLNNHNQPFNARILEFGFISAESAVMGLLKGWLGRFISIITTLFCGAVSRTHMNLSDSIVTWVKVMNCWLIPTLGSCNQQITRKKHHSTSYFGLKTHQKLTKKLFQPIQEHFQRNSQLIVEKSGFYSTDLKKYPKELYTIRSGWTSISKKFNIRTGNDKSNKAKTK